MPNSVEHPPHYAGAGIECIDAIHAMLGSGFTDFCLGNVVKYVWRCRDKGGAEDLRKARVYLGCAIGELEGGTDG